MGGGKKNKERSTTVQFLPGGAGGKKLVREG